MVLADDGAVRAPGLDVVPNAPGDFQRQNLERPASLFAFPLVPVEIIQLALAFRFLLSPEFGGFGGLLLRGEEVNFPVVQHAPDCWKSRIVKQGGFAPLCAAPE